MNKLSAYATARLSHFSRNTGSDRADTIGLLIPHQVTSVFADPFFSLLVRGVSQGCHLHHYQMLLCLCHTAADEQLIQTELACSVGLAGIIYASAYSLDRPLIDLTAIQKPVLFLEEPTTQENDDVTAPGVQPIEDMGRRAVETLVRRVANIPAAEQAVPLLAKEGAWSTLS